MRAEIVFEALRTTNRFAFCHLVFKAVRKLHKPSTRVQETVDNSLRLLAGAGQQQGEAKSTNAIETQQEQVAIAS